MMNATSWAYATAGLYWFLIVAWLLIVLFYWRENRRARAFSPIIGTLLVVVILDGVRTLFESLYFGTQYTARTGLIPYSLDVLLAEPQFIVVPKVFNLLAALIIIGVLLRRWFPAVATEIERQQHTERLCGELQEAHTNLQAAQMARDALMHMVVHDMRTPLTNIITGLQTVELEESGSPMIPELVDGALIGADRLLGMVNELLDISKMESGEMVLVRERFPIREVMEEAVTMVEALLLDKCLTLHLHVEEATVQSGVVEADREKIRRVLVNLLGNAIKFSPKHGTIRLSAAREAATLLRITVSDNGPGISEEDQRRIFDKFYQVQKGTGGGVASTGLGLTFCKMAVEAHGCSIGVDSTPGTGSCFWFTLPFAASRTFYPDGNPERIENSRSSIEQRAC